MILLFLSKLRNNSVNLSAMPIFWFFEGKDKNVDKIEALRAEMMEVLKHEPFMGERIPVR